MLKALKPANAGDLWEGVQNQEIISYSELGPLRDSDKHSFNPIGAPISDLDNKGLFQKSDRYKIFIFYINHFYYNSILINLPSKKLIREFPKNPKRIPQCIEIFHLLIQSLLTRKTDPKTILTV